MWHPFLEFDATFLGWLFFFLAVASVLLMLRLTGLSRRLRTSLAPLGMVSLEMSLSSTESCRIISTWDSEAREDARKHLCLDYWFIPVYTTGLAVLGVLSARWFVLRGFDGLGWLALLLAWGQWVAGLLEFAQNSTLLRMLQMYPDIPQRLTQLAGWCARVKFLLVVAAVICCLFGVAAWMI